MIRVLVPGADDITAIVLDPEALADGARVFTAKQPAEIERVGERATAWLAAQPDLEITELWIAQSSGRGGHRYRLCLWYRRCGPANSRRLATPPVRGESHRA